MSNYDFYKSDKYKELFDEITEAHEDNDVDTGIEIIFDIEQAKKDFDDNLPWWYKARWQIGNSQEVEQEARKLYKQNIYNRR